MSRSETLSAVSVCTGFIHHHSPISECSSPLSDRFLRSVAACCGRMFRPRQTALFEGARGKERDIGQRKTVTCQSVTSEMFPFLITPHFRRHSRSLPSSLLLSSPCLSPVTGKMRERNRQPPPVRPLRFLALNRNRR